MALAELSDLVALGALKVDASPLTDPNARRAGRLIELASAQAVIHLGVPEADIADDWTASQRAAVANVVAEIAARRLMSPAGPTSQQLVDEVSGWRTSLLTRADRRALDAILADVLAGSGGSGSMSIGVTRSDSSIMSWPAEGLSA